MNKTLFFHVGYPKTGSSALQWMLAVNRQPLAALGFHYPLVGDATQRQPGGNGIELAQLLKVGPAKAGQQHHDLFLRQLVQGDGHLVVSSEILCQAKPRALEGWLQQVWQTGAELKIIFYLRPYPSLIPSVWNQMVKSHGYKKGFEEYQQNQQPPHPQRRQLEKYLSLVGRERLCVRLFDREQMLGKNIHQDFLQAGLGLATSQLTGLQLEASDVNSSLNREQVVLQLLINQLRQGQPAAVCGEVLQALAEPGNPFRLSPGQQAELDARFAEDIAFYNRLLEGQVYQPAQGQGGELPDLTPQGEEQARAERIARLLGRPGAAWGIKLLLRAWNWGGSGLLRRWFS